VRTRKKERLDRLPSKPNPVGNKEKKLVSGGLTHFNRPTGFVAIVDEFLFYSLRFKNASKIESGR
jgi:hypothetical protein